MNPNFLSVLSPHAGFFAAAEFNSLKLPVGLELDGIEIRIDAPEPNFLNIGSIQFVRDDTYIDKADLLNDVIMSSSYEGLTPEQQKESVRKGILIHSRQEKNPSLTVRFRGSVRIDEIHIQNRWDLFWRRSQYLTVSGRLDGKTTFIYDNMDKWWRLSQIYFVAAKIEQRLKTRPDLAVSVISQQILQIASANEAQQLRFLLKQNIVRALQNGLLYSGEIDWNSAVSLVCIVPRPEEEELQLDLALVAGYVAHYMDQGGRFETLHLSPFSNLLNGPDAIQKMMSALNSLPKIRNSHGRRYIISKHNINASVLQFQSKEYVSALNTTLASLNEFNVEGAICYGTLLGAIRTGSLIEHDDDVDLIYVDTVSNTREEALQYSKSLQQRFLATGYSAWREGESLNFNVSRNGPSVDLFPVWFQEDEAFLMMEHFHVRAIPKQIITPLSSTKLCGQIFPSPHLTAEFLRERYGANWGTPNVFHEWPWELVGATPP